MTSQRRKKFRRIDFLDSGYWYPTQFEIFCCRQQRRRQPGGQGPMLCRRSRLAAEESVCLASLISLCWSGVLSRGFHLTGQYPEWWTGKRFNKPIRCWVVGESVILVRDTLQRQLCGGQDFGTGTIPLESFGKKPITVPGGTARSTCLCDA